MSVFLVILTLVQGVAILINNTFDFKLQTVEKDMDGNLLILNCFIHEKNIALINVYGPNKDSPMFYQELSNKMSRYNNSSFILAGDFNLILNTDIDSYNYLHLNNSKARDKLLDLILDYSMVDCWRENNLENKEYTLFRRNPVKKARLDFFLVSENI